MLTDADFGRPYLTHAGTAAAAGAGATHWIVRGELASMGFHAAGPMLIAYAAMVCGFPSIRLSGVANTKP